MKKRVGVLTADPSLYNKLRLLLRNVAEVEIPEEDFNSEIYDLVFCDIDTFEGFPQAVNVSRSKKCDLEIPFRYEDVLALIEMAQSKRTDSLTLLNDARHVLLSGEKIKLTEVEYKLLSELMAAEGGYVSRESLLKRVWGEGFDAGVVNVYVHYLRTKLERDGRKIILSSRKEGYGIDEKYRRGR